MPGTPSQTPPWPRRLSDTATILAILLGVASTAFAYWPGYMNWDALRQYGQAVAGSFDDWHPPAMQWLWRQMLPIQRGPATMFVLQLALHWGGLALLAAWAVRRAERWLAVAIFACGLMPLSLALNGEVIKDTLMAATLMAATGVLAWLDTPRSRRGSVALATVGIFLLIAAATLRFNAFLAALPLFVAFLPAPAWRGRGGIIGGAILGGAVLLAAMPVADRLIDAHKTHVGQSLVMFDLAGITNNSGTSVFPPLPGVADPVGTTRACYNPARWDRFAWWVDEPCAINFYPIDKAFETSGINPYLFWAKAVAGHPLAYAEHRMAHFNVATRLFSRGLEDRPVQIETPPNEWGFTLTPNPVLTAIDNAAVWSADTPLEWPIVWIALALGVIVVAPVLPACRLIMPLALSSFLYGTGYAVFSVASELRYHLWTILAAAVAGVIAASDLITTPVQRWRLALAATPVAGTLAACLIWRATSPI